MKVFDIALKDLLRSSRSAFLVAFIFVMPLATVAILTFMGAWNEVLWPLLVVRNEQFMTLPQLLTVLSLGGGAGPRQLATKLAAAMVLVVPVVAVYAFLQRFFIESMASAGIKG